MVIYGILPLSKKVKDCSISSFLSRLPGGNGRQAKNKENNG